MACIYATREDTSKCILIEIQCDKCGRTIKPNPNISESGWVKHGSIDLVTREQNVEYLCPECS
jgi:predicted RNA-binding Zn-ribbon protein involved in translation (DUF1610 family)